MAGLLPVADRRVRFLLDSGRFTDADAAFGEIVGVAVNEVGTEFHREVVLVHRALLAWRLGRTPLALELAAEGWTFLDVERPGGAAAAHAVGMLGYLLDAIGHHTLAGEFMSLSVQLAREADDADALALCLARQSMSWMFSAPEHPVEPTVEAFTTARRHFQEALSLVNPGQVQRRSLAGLARAVAGLGEFDAAEHHAERALALSRAAGDRYSESIADWVLSEIRRHQGRFVDARMHASRALDAAESVRDTNLVLRFSLGLSALCEQLRDASGEAAALRRTVRAGRTAARVLQEGLAQALEQRCIALRAQRTATAAQTAAMQDALTGLTNRLGLERQAPALLDRTASLGRVPWLVLADVDRFKDINDDAGHPVGDIALREVAQLLRRVCRAEDLVCRWAGDEFVVLIVDGHDEAPASGPAVAERIREAVENHDWSAVLGATGDPPTVSVGVAAGPGQLDHLFVAADLALYRAKRAGRNRVEIESQA